MQAVDVNLDTLRWRLVKASRRDPETLSLTFEPLEVAELRRYRKSKAWSRNKYTRAQAVESMVNEVRVPELLFDSPERDIMQARKSPDYPDVPKLTAGKHRVRRRDQLHADAVRRWQAHPRRGAEGERRDRPRGR